jgi:UDP-glucose 4-epimerase
LSVSLIVGKGFLAFKGKRVLIIGGAGFIGSWLVSKIISYGPEETLIVDNFFSGKMENIINAKHKVGNKLKIYKKDATDFEILKNIFLQEGDIEVVFNLAVKPLFISFIDPTDVFWTSVKIVSNLLEIQRRGMFRTLLHFSSSEAYGTAEYIPMDENHPLRPTTPYGAGKAAADHLIISYYKSYGNDVAIIRPFNNFGPRQNEKTYAGVVPTTILKILKGKPPVIFGDGNQTRDFIYVEDTVDATIKAYKIKATRGRILNIGQCKETSINDIVRMIANRMNYKGRIVYRRPRIGDVRRHCADISLAKRLIGFNPKTSLEQGLHKTIAWYTRKHGYQK